MKGLFKMRNLYPIALLSAFILSAGGCKTVGETSPFNFLSDRKVQITASNDFTKKLSHCVMVMPVEAKEHLEPYRGALEASLLRHVSEKFDRAIPASEVRKVADSNMLTLSFQKDLQTLRERMDCNTIVTARLIGPGEQNLIVWSGHEVGIEITFPEPLSRGHIWQGRHVTSRSSGGLPLSPLGAAAEIAEAQLHALDNDIAASVISDGVRRIMSRFPRVS